MNYQYIYNKYKNQIDRCINDVNEKIFKPLGIKPERVNLLVDGLVDEDEPKSIHLMHYLSEHDIEILGDMNVSGELDEYVKRLNRGFKFGINPERDFEGIYLDSPSVIGYTHPNSTYPDYRTPAVNFYWGWLPEELVMYL